MNDQLPSNPHFSPPASPSSIITLVLNLFIPGLGTIVGGRAGLGVGQLVMCLLGIPMLFLFFPIGLLLGLVLIVGSWIWGVVTGFQMLSASTGSGGGGPPRHFS